MSAVGAICIGAGENPDGRRVVEIRPVPMVVGPGRDADGPEATSMGFNTFFHGEGSATRR